MDCIICEYINYWRIYRFIDCKLIEQLETKEDCFNYCLLNGLKIIKVNEGI
jgi:hypothetical protein